MTQHRPRYSVLHLHVSVLSSDLHARLAVPFTIHLHLLSRCSSKRVLRFGLDFLPQSLELRDQFFDADAAGSDCFSDRFLLFREADGFFGDELFQVGDAGSEGVILVRKKNFGELRISGNPEED